MVIFVRIYTHGTAAVEVLTRHDLVRGAKRR